MYLKKLIALLLSLATLSTSVVFPIYGTYSYEQKEAHNIRKNLNRLLKKDKFADFSIAYRDLNNLKFSNYLESTFVEHDQRNKPANIAAVQSLIDVNTEINDVTLRNLNQRAHTAAEMIRIIEKRLQFVILPELFTENCLFLSKIGRDIHEINELIDKNKLLQKDDQSRLATFYKDLADLLRIPTYSISKPNKGIFEYGILAGLPKISSVDDGVNDIYILFQQLGNKNVGLPSAAENDIFMQRIASLKSAYQNINKDYSYHITEYKELNDRKQELQAIVDANKPKVIKMIRNALAVLVNL